MRTVCPYCGSTKVQKRGQHPRQRYQCLSNEHPKRLSRYFYGESSVARILLFDIETLPMQLFGWNLWRPALSPEFIIKDWCVLSYAAKWLFQPAHVSSVMTPKEALAYDDRRMVEQIWRLFEQADVIIAHNGDHFDVPRMNTRFLFHDLNRPSPYLTIDTRDTAKHALDISSNKLDYLGEYLGLGRKHPTDFDLWRRCAAGDKDALREMHEYNQRDIYLLEDVYVKLRPWIKHPNLSLYMTKDENIVVCPRCGSDDIDWSDKSYYTTAGIFEAYHCNNCGGWGRAHKRKRSTKSRVL